MERKIEKTAILLFVVIVSVCSSLSFILSSTRGDIFIPSGSFSKTIYLSEYESSLKGTKMDAPVFLYDSGKSGATVFIASGAHPNESGAILSTILMMENIKLESGRIFYMPVMNMSAYSETLPGYAYPEKYAIGNREFKIGSRNTRSIDQGAKPMIYVQYPSAQHLSSEESANINRAFPGRKDGSLTERAAYAITSLLINENVDYAFDLHEASVTYPVNSTIITDEENYDIAYLATLLMEEEGIHMNCELSRESNAGYSHSSWNEIPGLSAFLIEVPTPFIDRIPGVMSGALITEGRDAFLYKMAQKGYTTITYPEEGIDISSRVAMHVASMEKILKVSELSGKEVIEYSLMSSGDIMKNGVGYYLKEINKDSKSVEIIYQK